MASLLVMALALAAAVAVTALGRRTATPIRTGAAAVLVATAVWVAGVAVMLTGWNDIDGWIDCHPSCDGWHRVGGALFWFPPAFVAALLVVSLAAAVAARLR